MLSYLMQRILSKDTNDFVGEADVLQPVHTKTDHTTMVNSQKKTNKQKLNMLRSNCLEKLES